MLRCPEEVYAVMTSCWREDPSARPTFMNLRTFFTDLVVENSPQGPLVKSRLTVRQGVSHDDGHPVFETIPDPSVQGWHRPAPRTLSHPLRDVHAANVMRHFPPHVADHILGASRCRNAARSKSFFFLLFFCIAMV